MKLKRPLSSNPFKYKKIIKKKVLINALNNSNLVRKLPSFNAHNISNNSNIRSNTFFQDINNSNIISRIPNQKLDILNLIIKSSPNQYNYKKINKKSIAINPLFIRGTEQNLRRPNFSKNTEEVFYKYNLLYGSDSTNIIRTYSPKMRPTSASINGFNKKIMKDLNENILVFTEEEIAGLVKAKCQDLGINLRENMLVKFRDYCNSKCRNRIVDLSECYLGINSAKLISKILYGTNRISRLNLTRNNLGDYGVEILVYSIKNSTSLVYLNITSNLISYKGGKIIFEELRDQKSIIDLNVSSIEGTNRNRMTEQGIKDIELFLKKNLFIETLNISGNSIKGKGFELLCKGLNKNDNLINLNISNNDIHCKGLTEGLNFITCSKIYSLDISYNPILDGGLKMLTSSLKYFQNLKKLNLAYCSFQFPGFECLLNALQFNKKIEYLNVSGNDIKSKDFEKLKICFSTFGIRYLNMSKCKLGNETAFILGECLLGNESIRKLNISENKISDIGFKSFIPLFSINHNIEVFDCSINLISDVTAKEFIKNMKYNRALKKLNFYDNQLKSEIGNIFIELLETNKTLVYINLMYNRVKIKAMDEINRLLKLNQEKQKANFIPNILKDIKNLQFSPESFKFYTQNIQKKKSQQKVLYKKVKQDDKYFSKLIKKDNKKINYKVQEMLNLQNEISKIQDKIKGVKDKLEKLQNEIFDHEENMKDEIEEEKKKLKIIKEQNHLLMAEYKSTKKDFDNEIKETEEKLKKTQEKLLMANLSVQSMNKEIKKKYELLSNLYNPEMLVPINEQKKSIQLFKKATSNNISNSYNNLSFEQNTTKVTTSVNENILTSPSSSNRYKKKPTFRDNIKRSTTSKK